MLSLLTINWNPDPELFKFFGISIRYYGLLWLIGLALAYFIVQRQYSCLLYTSLSVVWDSTPQCLSMMMDVCMVIGDLAFRMARSWTLLPCAR